MKSLKRQLSAWLIGLLTVVGVAAGGISYFLARKDVSTLLDHQLRQVARSIDEGSQLASMQARYSDEDEEERENDFVIQVWYEKEPVRSSRPDFDLPEGKAPGFANVTTKEGKWRAYTIIYSNRTVQVSQSDDVRGEIASDAALRALLPVAGLIPLSWVLVAVGIERTLRPLAAVTAAATRRDATSLDPLPAEGIPEEAAPLVTEMNALLLRLRTAIESQRQFVSEAAHELRTPLGALQLQIENLSTSRSREDLESRISELRSGIKRASRLVGQLLKMARFEAESQTIREEVDLGGMVKSCVGDFFPIAESRSIDLGMTRDEAVFVRARADDLRILFDNLLDNAIRYTPKGGKVDVSVTACKDRAVVEVSDNGPGIPPQLLPRVFDRFFRASGQGTEGSGIGLAIVNAIASRESAQVELSNKHDGSGLVARVSFEIPRGD